MIIGITQERTEVQCKQAITALSTKVVLCFALHAIPLRSYSLSSTPFMQKKSTLKPGIFLQVISTDQYASGVARFEVHQTSETGINGGIPIGLDAGLRQIGTLGEVGKIHHSSSFIFPFPDPLLCLSSCGKIHVQISHPRCCCTTQKP